MSSLLQAQLIDGGSLYSLNPENFCEFTPNLEMHLGTIVRLGGLRIANHFGLAGTQ